jgi:hypothetical protein
MPCCVLEAFDLTLLRAHRVDRVDQEHDEIELAFGGGGCKVSAQRRDPVGARLPVEDRQHLRRAVDAPDIETPSGQRECDTTGANAEFEDPASARQTSQLIYRGFGVEDISVYGVVLICEQGSIRRRVMELVRHGVHNDVRSRPHAETTWSAKIRSTKATDFAPNRTAPA